MNIEAAKNHLRLYMDYHGQKGTLDGAVVAQTMAAIVQAEAMERQAAAAEKMAAFLGELIVDGWLAVEVKDKAF